MEFIGVVAEEKGLKGSESLSKLVDTFTLEKAVLTTNLLPGMKEHLLEATALNQTKTKTALQRLLTGIPLPSEKEAIESAVKAMAADYICSEFGMRYDRISPWIFQLERKLDYAAKDSYNRYAKLSVAIPLFANVSLGKSAWELEEERVRVLESGRDSYHVDISASVPPLTRAAKERAKQARAEYMEICAKALREAAISDVVLRDIESGEANLDLRVCWIPSLSELRVKAEKINKDPLLLASTYGRNFLVAKWDVLGEEPYEHYLREFTEQKAGA